MFAVDKCVVDRCCISRDVGVVVVVVVVVVVG